MNCTYCESPNAQLRATKADGLREDAYVCDGCWQLLKDPRTALPLLRGHLVLAARGTVPQSTLDKMLNSYMEILAGWKPRS